MAIGSQRVRPWFRRRPETLVALSSFVSAHPFEFPGLLLASSAFTAACSSAARIGCSRRYRTLCPATKNIDQLLASRYVSSMLAGLCYLFDEPLDEMKRTSSMHSGPQCHNKSVRWSCPAQADSSSLPMLCQGPSFLFPVLSFLEFFLLFSSSSSSLSLSLCLSCLFLFLFLSPKSGPTRARTADLTVISRTL